jgi:hypothetical protein
MFTSLDKERDDNIPDRHGSKLLPFISWSIHFWFVSVVKNIYAL